MPQDRTVLLYDLETNNYLHLMDRLHCIAILDRSTREIDSYAQDATGETPEGYLPLSEGLARLAAADVRYAHNAIRFDERVLRVLYPDYDWDAATALDTQVLAQARFIHLKAKDEKMAKAGKFPSGMVGRHSIEAWGHRLGVRKGDYKGGFDAWNTDMSDYCEQDVRAMDALLDVIAKAGVTGETVELEHAVARYLDDQQINGWPFDVRGAQQLEATLRGELSEIELRLVERFGWWYEANGEPRVPKQDRTMTKNRLAPVSFKEGCPYVRLKKVEFNPNSRQNIEHVFRTEYGWEPKEFTPTGQAKIDEQTLKGVDAPEAEDLIHGLTISKRLGQLADGRRAWLKTVEDEPNPETGLRHIHHVCVPGPVTHRMRHMSPNLGQVPAGYSEYGPECRSLFIVPPGWKMVGSDVSGLELRILGHHMFEFDSGEYAYEAIEGDVHSKNAEALGLDRPTAKTWIYAYLYGAGNKKLGSIALPNEADPKKLKARGKRDRGRFERSTPALGDLVERCKAEFRHYGYVKLLDGRPAYPRGEHSALNTKIQGDGAIVCKRWMVDAADLLAQEIGPQGWSGSWAGLGFIHDELQMAAFEEIADDVGQMVVSCIPPVGERYGIKIPLVGEYKVGDNWSETH